MTRLKSVTGAPLFVLVFIGGCLVVEEGVTDVMGPPSIVLQPASTRMVFFGQTKQFGATVRNALGEFVPSEVAWFSSDESVFTVIGGNVTAVGDGTAELRATLEQTTAVAAVTVEQTPASVPIVSGKGQRAVAGTPLDEPIVVHVVDEGGARMSGVTVSFTPADGGSVSSDVVETDANGEASTVWTLGPDKFGAQSLGIAAARAENQIRAFAVPATPIPDLGIEGGIRVGAGEPTDLEGFEITVDVVNLGNAATPGAFPLTLSVDGRPVESFEIEQLEAEERVELTYTPGPRAAGRHEVSIALDPDDEIDERFDDNNRASAQLSVAQQRTAASFWTSRIWLAWKRTGCCRPSSPTTSHTFWDSDSRATGCGAPRISLRIRCSSTSRGPTRTSVPWRLRPSMPPVGWATPAPGSRSRTRGPGFANEHWREAVFGEELMSTVLTSGSPPLSLITIESLADMGYGVDLTRADAYTLPTGGIAALTAPDGPVVHLHEHLGRYPVWLAPIGAVDRRKPVLKNDDPRRR